MSSAAPFVNFSLLVLIIYLAAKKPMREFLKNQNNEFHEKKKNAEAVLAKAKEKNQELSQKINNLETDLASTKEKMVQSFNNQAENMVKKAKETGEYMVSEVDNMIDIEYKEAKRTLKEKLVLELNKKFDDEFSRESKDNHQKVIHKSIRKLSDLVGIEA